jgi:uncharacterized protein YgfB (UPF0149 family)
MLQVTFPEIARILEVSRSSVPAAESHGCLCGALCVTTQYSLDRWLDEIIPEEQERTQADRQALSLLFADTLQALRGGEMDFELLLPDDEAPLESRAAALSQWCQGFLYGFGTGQPSKLEQLPATVDEVLRDLTHIGRAAVESGEGSEEEEEAYSQVMEYVRVGVQLIHDELFPARESSDPDDEQGDGGEQGDGQGVAPSLLH